VIHRRRRLKSNFTNLALQPEELSAGVALVLLLDLLHGVVQVVVLLQVRLLSEACAADLADVRLLAWDRCYDFLNIFAEKFSKKNWRFFTQNKAKLCKILIICNIVFLRKTPIFSPKNV
jgi:hypothetical protein